MTNLRMTLALGAALVAATTAVACGGSKQPVEQPAETAMPTGEAPPDMTSEPPPVEPTATAAATTEPPPPAKKAWSDMDMDEKKKFMAEEVMPKAGKLMTDFDAKEFPKVECKTCHGDPKNGFKMPNPKLPKLDPKDGFKKHMAKDAKVVEFMMQKLTPEVGNLLGHQPFDPATGKGFGCGGCHVMVK